MITLEQLQQIATVGRINADATPSASIAIIEDGKISACNISNGQKDAERIYQAASISKAITALAVAKLVDEGRISYDTEVVEHLPQSAVACIVEPGTAHPMEHVTVRMLISHTSGLSQGGFPGYAGEPASAEDILSGRAPSNTPHVKFLTFPGAQYSYSGGGLTVLQLFLEQVTGLPFPKLMEDMVLKPLGMTRSHYGTLPDHENTYAKAHYTAYTEANSPYHRFAELAAAGLWTTPTDLLKAIVAVQNSLHHDDGFLEAETAKEMLTQTPQVASTELTMALGWAADDSVFGHSGGNAPGFQCYLVGSHGGVVNVGEGSCLRMPAGNAVAVMTNGCLGVRGIRKIVMALFWLKGWPRSKSLAGLFANDEFVPYPAPDGTPTGKVWRQWAGQWQSDWEIVDDSGPALRFQVFPSMQLLPAAAAPVSVFEEGREEFVFVVHGLDAALRFTWEKDERVIELVQGDSGVRSLKRSSYSE